MNVGVRAVVQWLSYDICDKTPVVPGICLHSISHAVLYKYTKTIVLQRRNSFVCRCLVDRGHISAGWRVAVLEAVQSFSEVHVGSCLLFWSVENVEAGQSDVEIGFGYLPRSGVGVYKGLNERR